MTLATIVWRSTLRNRFRAVATILAGAIATLLFVLLRTVVHTWTTGVENAATDRLVTRAKISMLVSLPRRYVDSVRTDVDGIQAVSYLSPFSGRWSKDTSKTFANVAVGDNFFDVAPEIVLPPTQLTQWRSDKVGVIVGDKLAEQLNLKVGDRFTLAGTLYPGNWDFTVDGIYTVQRGASIDRSTMFMRWDYLDESLPDAQREAVSWLVSRVRDPSQSARIATRIDSIFASTDTPTSTMSERASNNAFLSTVNQLMHALDVISVMSLFIMMFLVGNTIAMGVRERTVEYGTLRAIGFPPSHIWALIVGEGVATALSAGLLGLALSYPIVQQGIGRWLAENLSAMFPSVQVTTSTDVASLGLCAALGAVAAFLPARRISSLPVVSLLRHVG